MDLQRRVGTSQWESSRNRQSKDTQVRVLLFYLRSLFYLLYYYLRALFYLLLLLPALFYLEGAIEFNGSFDNR